jgi:nucleoid-associated protein YgaU
MVNVLDVLETTDSISLAPKGKVAEADKTQPRADTKQIDVEATTTQAKSEAGPSVPAETKPMEFEEKATEKRPQSKFRLKRLPLLLPKL